MNSAISLKLFSFGIQKFHDPNWTGLELFDKLKQHVRQRVEPKNMLFETLQNGLLLHLGMWIYEEYLIHYEEGLIELEGEYILWYLEDYIDLLIDSGVGQNEPLILRTIEQINSFNILYNDDDENIYYEQLQERDLVLKKLILSLSEEYEDSIQAKKLIYAQDFAERVFHDRVLCEFISKLLIVIGFDGAEEENEEPKQWIKRKYLQSWAKKAIIARDRGQCTECNRNLVMELVASYHFDHILPLFQGGTNDLSNFQLLCERCNLEKSKNIIPVNTSIPKYLQFKKSKNLK